MKTTQSYLSGIFGFGACLVATLGLGITPLIASNSVTVSLAGAHFTNGQSIFLDSGSARLDPATAYTFEVVGSCHGTGKHSVMISVAPKSISLKALLNSFKPKSAKFLSGTYLNTAGKFPFQAIDKPYSRVISTSAGPVSFSATFTGGVYGGPVGGPDVGKVYFNITNVSIVPPAPVTIGALEFDPGAKLVITVKP